MVRVVSRFTHTQRRAAYTYAHARTRENRAISGNLPRREPSMYSNAARALRQCQGITKRGTPCRQWAVWGDTVCVQHGGHRTYGREKTRYVPCTCAAYAWPHRPAGGLCRWPDSPQYRLTTRPGTHMAPRSIRGFGRRYWQAEQQDRRYEADHLRGHIAAGCSGCQYCREPHMRLVGFDWR